MIKMLGSIKGKVQAATGLVVALVLIISITIVIKLENIQKGANEADEMIDLSYLIWEYQGADRGIYNAGVRALETFENSSEFQKYLQSYNKAKDNFAIHYEKYKDFKSGYLNTTSDGYIDKVKKLMEDSYKNMLAITNLFEQAINDTNVSYEKRKLILSEIESKMSERSALNVKMRTELYEYSPEIKDKLNKDIITAKNILGFLSIVGLSIIGFVMYKIIQLVINKNRSIAELMGAFAKGDTSYVVAPWIASNKEIALILDEAEHVKGYINKAARLQNMIDNLSLPVMLCDKNFNITYINKASHAALKRLERLLPVTVDKLVGVNIDIFHKNPAHQRKLLVDETRMPHKAEFMIGDEWLSLNANILKNSNGQIDGSFVDWSIVTEKKRADAANKQAVENINRLIASASDGDLEAKIDTNDLEGVYLEISSGMNKLMNTVLVPVSKSIEVMNDLSKGVLYHKLDGDFRGMFASMQNALNATIDKLSSITVQIKESANSVRSASSEIASGGTDLSSRTEHQASNLEETASSMEELTETVQKNTQNANNANKVAIDARQKAEKGGEVVGSAVGAMGNIEKSSQKISDIIGVIDEIAFQTNLLALNAAVEAARAGDAGKGFAVVASEVRTLAGRSASASKEIKKLIIESAEQVQDGAVLVKQAGETLGDIVSSVKQVADLISDIATASNEQANGIKEINAAVLQMDEMTQQNAALVEESTAASHSLVEQANTLNRLVSFFKLSENQQEEMAAEAPKPMHSSPAKKPATHGKSENMKKLSDAKKPVPAAQSSTPSKKGDDGWEEF